MEKKCNICKEIKNIEYFYKNQTKCKRCTKEYDLKNKDKIKIRKELYRKAGKRSMSDKKILPQK